MMRILVTGAAGRLGGRLVDALTAVGHDAVGADVAQVHGTNVQPLDITDWAATRALADQIKPELIIHPAAWTDVDGCAREQEKAIRINGLGAQNMALAAAEFGAPILHVSTNEVFSGRSSRAYREYDSTEPINPYAYSKWVGEQAVMRVNPRHYVVRTAWLFAHGGKNFIQSMLNAAQAGKDLRVVTNEVGNPTYNNDLADAIVKLIETERYGIYHLVNEGACSRYDFARYVLDRAGYASTPITPITSHQWQRASTPPEYAPLENLAGKLVGITLRPWREAVDAFLAKEGLLR